MWPRGRSFILNISVLHFVVFPFPHLAKILISNNPCGVEFMNKLRKRLVNFRVTDQEFEKIKSASDRQGARCISEFARSLMLGNLTLDCQAEIRDSCNVRLGSYEQRLTMLEHHVSRLLETLFESTAPCPIPFPKTVNSAPEKPR